MLIEAMPRLVEVHTCVHSFSTKVCEALLCHATSLGKLKLLLLDDDEKTSQRVRAESLSHVTTCDGLKCA